MCAQAAATAVARIFTCCQPPTTYFHEHAQANIKYWERTGSINEDEARRLSTAVKTLRSMRHWNRNPTTRVQTASPPSFAEYSPGGSKQVTVAWSAATPPDSHEDQPKAGQISLAPIRGAKVAPLADPKQSILPTGGAGSNSIFTSAFAATDQRQLSRAPSLGIQANFISQRRRTTISEASGLVMVPGLAHELAEVIQEAIYVKEAVREWWDVNVKTRGDVAVEREMLVALVEAIRPALQLGKLFIKL